MTSIIDDIVPRLRRSIGDIKEPYEYTNNALAEYIEDSVDKIRLDWKHGYTIDRNTHTILEDVGGEDQMLFVAQARYDLRNVVSDISYKTGTMSVTRKSTDKTRYWKELKELIKGKLLLECIGVSSNEFDNYERRFEQILYY